MTGPFIHERALCESVNVGDGTRVWAFAHILPGAQLGQDCNICDGVFVENNVIVGDRVTIKCGVQLWDGVRFEDDVFVGPNATFTNDRFPRSRQHPDSYARTVVKSGASLGANCVILPGVTVGRKAMVGAGSVVTRDVPPHAIVVGNPARIVGYSNVDDGTASNQQSVRQILPETSGLVGVGGAQILNLNRADDVRGSLVSMEFARELPFVPQRTFLVFDVPSRETRGEHAHRQCEQFLVCVSGAVSCIVDDGSRRVELLLDRPDRGLYMPRMTWGTQYKYSPDAVLMVFASLPYDSDDYIRDYEGFLAECSLDQGSGRD